jgi:hypothetical protein
MWISQILLVQIFARIQSLTMQSESYKLNKKVLGKFGKNVVHNFQIIAFAFAKQDPLCFFQWEDPHRRAHIPLCH